jgi:hypothetical protein
MTPAGGGDKKSTSDSRAGCPGQIEAWLVDGQGHWTGEEEKEGW